MIGLLSRDNDGHDIPSVIFRASKSFHRTFFFLTPFILQSRYQWFCEALSNLLCFPI